MAGLTDISLGNFTNVLYGAVNAYTQSTLRLLGDVQTVGDIADEATIIDVQAYGQKYLKKLVGSANSSAIEVVCNYDPSDAGQTDLLLAYNTSTQRSIGIMMNVGEPADPAAPFAVDGHHIVFNALVASASITNSFDETRTITFSIVPVGGAVNGPSDGYAANPVPA